MTTARFSNQAGAIARAMNMAYERGKAGEATGVLVCPRCGGRLNFNIPLVPEKSNGHCTSAGCIRWQAA